MDIIFGFYGAIMQNNLIIKKMETLEITPQQSAVGNLLLTGMTAHTGIVGDKDDLFVLDAKTSKELNFEQGRLCCYELAKLSEKSYTRCQPVQVDLNFNQTGQLMILQKHFNPFPCSGEVIHCTPSDKLIEYVKTRCK